MVSLARIGHRGLLGEVEPDELVVLLDELGRRLLVAELVGELRDLVVEDVGEPLQEDERQDVVLELRGVERPANLAGGVPEPSFQRPDI